MSPARDRLVPFWTTRDLANWTFEDGSVLRMTLSGPIETEEALLMAEKFIALRRRELAEIKSRGEANP